MTVTIHTGDCLEILPTLPAESVHCVVTSPPYWGLRDYGVEGLGLEPTLAEHIENMVGVFREVRRVLRKDGCCWINYGDCYTSGGREGHGTRVGYKQATNRGMNGTNDPARPAQPEGLKPKDLCMLPARIALALQADGWWIRSEIVWSKPNPMPESVTDRPTSAHEKIYLLSKSKSYFYDAEAVREPASYLQPNSPQSIASPYGQGFTRRAKGNAKTFRGGNYASGNLGSRDSQGNEPNETHARNLRNVWTVATQPFSEAHFATFPPALIEPCIKAGTSEKGCCGECGAPWVRELSKPSGGKIGKSWQPHIDDHITGNSGGKFGQKAWDDYRSRQTTGWRPPCSCGAGRLKGAEFIYDVVPCTVLDPFGGSGTTGLVADRLGRNAILIELNSEYADMARGRIQDDAGMFAEVSA